MLEELLKVVRDDPYQFDRLTAALKGQVQLSISGLPNEHLETTDIYNLVIALNQTPGLQSLQIFYSALDLETCQKLAEYLSANPGIEFKIENCPIPAEGWKLIIDSLSIPKDLKSAATNVLDHNEAIKKKQQADLAQSTPNLQSQVGETGLPKEAVSIIGDLLRNVDESPDQAQNSTPQEPTKPLGSSKPPEAIKPLETLQPGPLSFWQKSYQVISQWFSRVWQTIKQVLGIKPPKTVDDAQKAGQKQARTAPNALYTSTTASPKNPHNFNPSSVKQTAENSPSNASSKKFN